MSYFYQSINYSGIDLWTSLICWNPNLTAMKKFCELCVCLKPYNSAIWFVYTRIRLKLFCTVSRNFWGCSKNCKFTHASQILSHLKSIFTEIIRVFVPELSCHKWYGYFMHIIFVMNPIFDDNIELLRVHWCAKFVSLKTARGLTKNGS